MSLSGAFFTERFVTSWKKRSKCLWLALKIARTAGSFSDAKAWTSRPAMAAMPSNAKISVPKPEQSDATRIFVDRARRLLECACKARRFTKGGPPSRVWRGSLKFAFTAWRITRGTDKQRKTDRLIRLHHTYPQVVRAPSGCHMGPRSSGAIMVQWGLRWWLFSCSCALAPTSQELADATATVTTA